MTYLTRETPPSAPLVCAAELGVQRECDSNAMKQFVPALDTGCAKMADCNDQAMRQHNKAAVSGPLLCGKSGHADSNHVLGLLSRKGKLATRVSARAECYDLRNRSSPRRRPLLFVACSVVMTGVSTHSCHLVLQTLHKSVWKHGTGFDTFAIDAKNRWPLGQCTTTCSWPNDQSSGSTMNGNMLNG